MPQSVNPQTRILNRIRADLPPGTADLVVQAAFVVENLLMAQVVREESQRATVVQNLVHYLLIEIGKHVPCSEQVMLTALRACRAALLDEITIAKLTSQAQDRN